MGAALHPPWDRTHVRWERWGPALRAALPPPPEGARGALWRRRAAAGTFWPLGHPRSLPRQSRWDNREVAVQVVREGREGWMLGAEVGKVLLCVVNTQWQLDFC